VSAPYPSPPPAGSYRIPSLGWRILGGALRLIPLALLLIGLPVAALSFLKSHGFSIPVPLATVEAAGIAITVLVVARYILKPTALYGPLSIATSAVTLVYLYVLLADSTYHVTIPNVDIGVAIGYRELILILMIVPALALAAGVVTTIEDVTHPQERLPFDYPP
jgi:hypothetical protein